jgi:hypothetical protein
MSPRTATRWVRIAHLVVLLVVPLLLVACAAATGAAAPSATSTAQPTIRAAATPAVTAAPGGPTEYALWIERQGFGGSSGLHQGVNNAEWIRDHAFEATLFDVEDSAKHADRLANWLDEHPPTACWIEYHATVRATLGRLLDAYAAAHDARAAGKGIPLEVGETLVAEAHSAFDLPAPSGC